LDRAVVLFTRDLRVHDNPALAAAAREAAEVVPLFVLDPAILDTPFGRSANRRRFLAESLADLDQSLRKLGSSLAVRRGDTAAELARLAPDAVYAAEDASRYAQGREQRLADRFDVRLVSSTTAIAFDDLKTYRVFTPYFRAWSDVPLRPVEDAPRLGAHGVEPGNLPAVPAGRSPEAAKGGECAGRVRLDQWLSVGLARYGQARGGDDLAADHTSRLSPYLHFGCVSALECVRRARETRHGGEWIRELCWRDFYAQLLHAFPQTSRSDLYDRAYARGGPGPAFGAWCEGRTGYPLVDAGMRQLEREGWMHNRARLVTASFLVKDLGVDWRHGAAWFEELLLDGDVASNRGNWQWVAGTGVDHTQGGRMFNPTLQAKRRDPLGDYVRRYVPELAHLESRQIHEPWKVGGVPGYPEPIVDHAEIARRRRRGEQPTLF
jgi:deoxyribodipyrimidine photo-lyase